MLAFQAAAEDVIRGERLEADPDFMFEMLDQAQAYQQAAENRGISYESVVEEALEDDVYVSELEADVYRNPEQFSDPT